MNDKTGETAREAVAKALHSVFEHDCRYNLCDVPDEEDYEFARAALDALRSLPVEERAAAIGLAKVRARVHVPAPRNHLTTVVRDVWTADEDVRSAGG